MDEYVMRAAKALARVREEKPLVLSITNTVVTNWTANCLLALGAKPAMMEEPEEAAELAARAGGVLINLGTVTSRQFETMQAAVTAANEAHVPWVLDPVAVDKLTFRRTLTEKLVAQKPTLIRGNSEEINFLMGTVPNLQGICPLLSTGPVDEIWGTVPSSEIWGTVPSRIQTTQTTQTIQTTQTTQTKTLGSVPLKVNNGVELLTRVTGTGCAQGALAAAFCAVEPDPVVAALATSLTMSLAGELAYAKARHPGSFQIALLDALEELEPEDIQERAKVIV